MKKIAILFVGFFPFAVFSQLTEVIRTNKGVFIFEADNFFCNWAISKIDSAVYYSKNYVVVYSDGNKIEISKEEIVYKGEKYVLESYSPHPYDIMSAVSCLDMIQMQKPYPPYDWYDSCVRTTGVRVRYVNP